jgi:hypothetical protein
MESNNTQESRALAALPTTEPDAPRRNVSNTSLMLDSDSMDKMVRVAELMASSRVTVPTHLQKNAGDCLAVVMQAVAWGMNPFSVAQKTYQIGGRLGYEAQLVSAVINNSGAVKDRFNFEWFGDWSKIIGKFKTVESKTKKDDNGHPKKYIVPDWDPNDEVGLGIRVWATIKGEATPRVLELLMAQARTRNSTLWTEDPKQQIAYLAQSRWSRLYTPDVTLGVYIPDELETASIPRDMGPAEVLNPTVPLELLNNANAAAAKGVAAYQAFWKAAGQDTRKLLAGEHERLKGVAFETDKNRTVETSKPVATNQSTGEITTTAEEVLKKINAAKNEDALNIAADWMNALPEDVPRDALNSRYDERLAEMRAA